MKQIKIKILPNGQIEAETKGMKGKTCLKYIETIEKMTDASTDDSKFNKEYYEVDNSEMTQVEEEIKVENGN